MYHCYHFPLVIITYISIIGNIKAQEYPGSNSIANLLHIYIIEVSDIVDNSAICKGYPAMLDIIGKLPGRWQDWTRMHAQPATFYEDRLPNLVAVLDSLDLKSENSIPIEQHQRSARIFSHETYLSSSICFVEPFHSAKTNHALDYLQRFRACDALFYSI